MRKASIRDLRYRFPEVEGFLRKGEEVAITKRRRVIARLIPQAPARSAARPDFLGRLKSLYGKKLLKTTGAELLAKERERH